MKRWLVIISAAIGVFVTACGASTSAPPRPFRGEIDSLHMFNSNAGWASGVLSSGEAVVSTTNNGGSTWLQRTPPQLHSVQRLSMDPVSVSAAWIAASNSKGRVDACLTRNTGRSWKCFDVTTQENMQTRALWPSAIDFVNTSTGWIELQQATAMIAARAELWQTRDGGRTWKQLFPLTYSGFGMAGPINFSSSKVGVHIVSTDSGYSNGVGGHGIYTTFNGGRTWTLKRPSGALSNTYQETLPTNKMTAMSDTAHLWITYNGQVGTPLTISNPLVQLLGENLVVAVTRDNLSSQGEAAIYLSSNAGKTWYHESFARSPIGKYVSPSARYSVSQIEFITKRAGFVLLKKNHVLGSVLFRTLDGGKHWSRIWL